MRTITGLEELKRAEGETLGTSDWHRVTQDAVNAFADVTGDHQWIHTDPTRAAETPFGGTIAHGYYTLSLAPRLSEEILSLQGFAFGVNYGLNKVRFPMPVKVGARIRGRAVLVSLTDVPAGKQLTVGYTIEVEGEAKPACVAETVVLLLSAG
jgi:acyl dehydratase